MTKKRWTAIDMPHQKGRVVIVTGANSGIGLETAKAFAGLGATVVIAGRHRTSGVEAINAIHAGSKDAAVAFVQLDLANLRSVHDGAAEILNRFERIDILINNAGVMMPRRREETRDGFELQLGTNHLGHFALTLLLLERIVATTGSRIVNVSSAAQKAARLDLDDLQWQTRPYRRMASYGASKLANMLFTRELQHRLEAARSSTIAVACHPGWTRTNLLRTTPLFRLFNPLFAMPPWQGALPTLYAAVAADVVGGGYYGPDGLWSLWGYPAPCIPSPAGLDDVVARRLWQLSERLVGISAPFGNEDTGRI